MPVARLSAPDSENVRGSVSDSASRSCELGAVAAGQATARSGSGWRAPRRCWPWPRPCPFPPQAMSGRRASSSPGTQGAISGTVSWLMGFALDVELLRRAAQQQSQRRFGRAQAVLLRDQLRCCCCSTLVCCWRSSNWRAAPLRRRASTMRSCLPRRPGSRARPPAASACSAG